MTGALATVLVITGVVMWAASWACIIADRSFWGPRAAAADALAVAGGASVAAGCFLQGADAPAAVNTLYALIAAWSWRRKRRDRKRAPKAYGAKSRARVAALVRKAREAAKPRPVPRPAPGGAR